MSIPESPQTREEQYLNAIATGNASGIPETPQTREEMYLDAIARNGGGGGSSGGGVLVVHDVDGTLDKTWQEIYDAGAAVIWMQWNESSGVGRSIFYVYATYYDSDDNGYYVNVFHVDNGEFKTDYFWADSATSYPSLD